MCYTTTLRTLNATTNTQNIIAANNTSRRWKQHTRNTSKKRRRRRHAHLSFSFPKVSVSVSRSDDGVAVHHRPKSETANIARSRDASSRLRVPRGVAHRPCHDEAGESRADAIACQCEWASPFDRFLRRMFEPVLREHHRYGPEH